MDTVQTPETDQGITIQIPRSAKIYKAASKDLGRYAYHNVALQGPTQEHGTRLVATDGRKLAVVPVAGQIRADTTEILLPQSVVKEATKGTGKKPDHGILTIDPDSGTATGCVPGKSMVGDKIDAVGAFPKVNEDYFPSKAKNERGCVRLGLNAKYLLELAQAIGAENESVVLTIELEEQGKADTKAARVNKPIHVQASSEGIEGAYGYLMPIVTE